MDHCDNNESSLSDQTFYNDSAKWLIIPSKIMLKGASVWPENYNKLTKTLNYLCLISFVLTFFGQIYYIKNESGGLGPAAYALTLFIICIETTARRIMCYIQREKLFNILSKIQYDFWPSNLVDMDLQKQLKNESRYLFIFTSIYTFSAYLSATQMVVVTLTTGNTPLNTAYPFSWRESPYYEIAYIWQGFLLMEIVFNICGIDLFFVSLLSICVAQFKLIGAFLLKNMTTADKNRTEKMKVITQCIKQHNILINVCRDVNDAFTYFILVQMLASIGTVCVSGFVITAVPEYIYIALPYLMGHFCELLIYCYMGSELINESVQLSNTAFLCDWHLIEDNKDIQKYIIFIIRQSQKPIYMSAGGFGSLNLTTFVKLLQFSFSVYTLLNSMMNN